MKLSKPYHIKDFKFLLVLSVLALSIIGVLAVGSAEPSSQMKQIIGIIMGIIVMVIISMIDYEWLLNLYWLIYGFNLLLLLYVHFLGMELNGAKRWINLGFTTLQPSDFTKIFMILFFAKFLMNHEARMKEPLTIVKSVLLIAPSLLLIYKQPNLSNTLYCGAVLYFDVHRWIELQVHWHCTCNCNSGSNHCCQHRCYAKPAIFERIPAKTYSCLAGTGKICG